jgi:hypothetical protein
LCIGDCSKTVFDPSQKSRGRQRARSDNGRGKS